MVDKNSAFLKSIGIIKGPRAGVLKGMPVTKDNYLIGRVVETNYLSSRVLLLNDLICKEEKWLNKQEHKKKFILQLEKLGWNISFEEWTEFIYQKVDSSTIKRWLNEGSEYREIILKNCEEETLIRLQELFKRLDGQTIKQKLIHTKFLAKNNN